MSSTPQVSIIIPVYNTEKYLNECLDSIIAQTFKDIEIICVNDGSTDNSLKILESYQKKHKNIKIITQKNGGAGKARNTGLEAAKGKYICFWDSDDIFEPKAIETLYTQAEKSEADITICRMQMFNTQTKQIIPAPLSIRTDLLNGKTIFSRKTIPEKIFQISVGWAEDKLFNTTFIRKNKLSFPLFKSSEDAAFTLQALMKAEKITYVDDVLISYRVKNTKSVSNNRDKSPTDFYKALQIVHKEALRSGIYEQIKQSFANYVLHFSLWQIHSIHNKKIQKQLAKDYKTKYFKEFDIHGHSKSYFYNTNEYYEYLYNYHPHATIKKVKHRIGICFSFIKAYLLFPWYIYKIYEKSLKQ